MPTCGSPPSGSPPASVTNSAPAPPSCSPGSPTATRPRSPPATSPPAPSTCSRGAPTRPDRSADCARTPSTTARSPRALGFARAGGTPTDHTWPGDLWTRSRTPAPEHFIARGWDECLAVLHRLQEAVRTVSPETDACLATGAGWIAEEAPGPCRRIPACPATPGTHAPDASGPALRADDGNLTTGPSHRAAVLPALPRRARHRPAPGRMLLRRLRLHRLPHRRLRGRLAGRGGLARRLGGADRVPGRPVGVGCALGRLGP
ncbi:hypothetical protein SRB17_67850 [Streptomyces sp. RB17]|nr:hypothetical protein [Streptomyces sp. RB17]